MTQEEILDVTEADLQPVETKLEDLPKEDLVRIVKEKEKETESYKDVVNGTHNRNKELVELYNNDMQYLSTVSANLLKVTRQKEDAIKAIISNTLTLMTIDREVIAPERKENE